MDDPKNNDAGGRRTPEYDRRRNFSRPQRNKKPGPPSRPDDDFNWNKVLKVVLSWSAIILVVFLVMTLFKSSEPTEVEVSYSEYQDLLHANHIKRATVKKSELTNFDFHGELKEAQTITRNSRSVAVTRFMLTLPIMDSAVIKEWGERGVDFTVEKEDNTWMSALINALPWVLLLVVWLIIMRRMQGTGQPPGDP